MTKAQHVEMCQYGILDRNSTDISAIGTTSLSSCVGVIAIGDSQIFVAHLGVVNDNDTSHAFKLIADLFKDSSNNKLIFVAPESRKSIISCNEGKPINMSQTMADVDMYLTVLNNLFNCYLGILKQNVPNVTIDFNYFSDLSPASFMVASDGTVTYDVSISEFNRSEDHAKYMAQLHTNIMAGNLPKQLTKANPPTDEKFNPPPVASVGQHLGYLRWL